MKQVVNRLIFLLSILGILISLYLLEKYITGEHIACGPKSGSFDCDAVRSSAYSSVGGIPLPFFGLVFYLLIFILSFLKTILVSKEILLNYLLIISAAVGLLVSGYLLYLELYVIHAICLWCTISGLISLSIFILTLCLKFLNSSGTPSKV